MKKIDFLKLAASIGVCFVAAAIGSFFTMPSIGLWYATLNKPFFSPPNWVFAPVWTLLYVMMGIALYLVWMESGKQKTKYAVELFALQLILNVLWSMLFFGLHSPLAAFACIIALWVAIFLTIKSFSKISKPASLFLLPYIAWVSFAAILNLAIVVLNQ